MQVASLGANLEGDGVVSEGLVELAEVEVRVPAADQSLGVALARP